MEIQRIEGATRVLGKPQSWDDEKGVECGSLPILDIEVVGKNAMVSAWKPTDEELGKLVAGAPLHLIVYGTAHPPVMLSVDTNPDYVDEIVGPIRTLEKLAKEEPLDLPGDKPGLFEEHMDQMGFVCLNTEGDASVYACTPKIAHDFHQHARDLEDEQSDIHELKALVRELFKYLEAKEESDSGNVFSPTYISSCRAMVANRLGTLLPRMKELAQL